MLSFPCRRVVSFFLTPNLLHRLSTHKSVQLSSLHIFHLENKRFCSTTPEEQPQTDEANPPTPSTPIETDGQKEKKRYRKGDSEIGAIIDKAPTEFETYLPLYQQYSQDFKVISFLSRQMEKNNVAPTREILNIQQFAFGKLGDRHLIYKNAVKLMNLKESISTEDYFNILLSFKSLADKEAINDVLTEMEKKNIPYNMNIFSLLLNQYLVPPVDLENVQKLRKKLDESGLPPSSHVLNCFLRIYSEAEQTSEALGIWEEMKKKGCKISLESFPYLLKTLKDPKEIEDLKKKCESSLRNGTAPTLSSILKVACQLGDESVIQKVTQEMNRKKLQRSTETLLDLIAFYGRINRLDGCLHYHKELKSQGAVPTIDAYNSILSCNMKRNTELSRADELFDEMKKNNVSPNEDTLLILCEWYKRKKRTNYDDLIDKATEAKVSLTNLGNRILRNQLQSNNHEGIIKAVNFMQSSNTSLSDLNTRDLFKYFSRVGNMPLLRKTIELADTQGIALPIMNNSTADKLRSYVANRDLTSVVQSGDLKKALRFHPSGAFFVVRDRNSLPQSRGSARI